MTTDQDEITETQEGLAEEAHPESTETDGPPTFGENNREMPQQLKDILSGLLTTLCQRDLYDRRIEVLTDRMLRFYDDGVQHIYPNWGTGVYQFGVAGATVDLGQNRGQIECPDYMGAYNIFRARRRAIDAVLTQVPPGVVFEPDTPGDPEGEQGKEIAEGYRHLFDKSNDVKGLQAQTARFMELSGRTILWTFSTRNKKWGINDEGEPRQMETARAYGTLESRVPITCRDRDKLLFVFLYDDPDVLIAKAENPWIRKQITPGQASPGESDWERFARLGTRQARKGNFMTGSAYAHLVTEMNAFLAPAAFEEACCEKMFEEAGEKDVNKDGSSFTVGDKFRQMFPDGCHLKYLGKTYSESWNEAMCDAIDIEFPDIRDGMTGGALLEPMKLIQDVYNDYKNAERENYEKGWPATYFKGSDTDYDSIVDTRAGPARFHLIKEGSPETPITDMIYREEGFDIPESFVQSQEELRGAISQDVTGANSAIQGTSKADQTASGQAMDRTQSVGMLGPTWGNMQRLWAGMYLKAVLLASANPDHAKEIAVAVPGKGIVRLQLEKIRRGTLRCKPDLDSSFPESTASQRANMAEFLPLIQNTPLGAAMFQVPDNWNEILELNGNPDIELIPAIAYRKQMREIEILLGEPPNPPDPQAVSAYQMQHAAMVLQARAAGLPEPPFTPPGPTPSIMPSPDDFHQWESMKCATVLSSEDVWLRMNVGDPETIQAAQAGIQNLRLHKAVHDQFMAQQQAAMAPPAPAGPPAGAGAPPPHHGAPEAHPAVQKKIAPPGSPGAPVQQ